ncbi:tRNA pseudouridine(55) synthase TruB [Boudabousia tangfeifanii]|uniref:tRNA pseudouridine synthase B n=1 Tax=Boudabousia tangfeifanii TaxID=1912795 RepID=A0A1D9MMI9_9ACTO|nr:tRNA pseudouridine(55) synthase TruB [Boudabousia tangfeifanii]
MIVDKPLGFSSHDVVGMVRRLAATKKVGHAGTLDPQASGVLVIGIGKATKLLTYLVGKDKSYRATIRLGQSTETDDAAGELLQTWDARHLSSIEIDQALATFKGEIMQVPTKVSAIKIDGKRAYQMARDGEEVKLAARPVTISQIRRVSSLRRQSGPNNETLWDFDVVVDCSSGTYIRAIARDLGEALGMGGHLVALRRTRVGSYDLSQAQTVLQLGSQIALDNEAEQPQGLSVIDLATVCQQNFPVRIVTPLEAKALSYGQFLPAHETGEIYAELTADHTVVALTKNQGKKARPVYVLAPA